MSPPGERTAPAAEGRWDRLPFATDRDARRMWLASGFAGFAAGGALLGIGTAMV